MSETKLLARFDKRKWEALSINRYNVRRDRGSECRGWRGVESTVDGRFTARMDEGFVVFVMGVRVNRLWDLRGWPPTLLSLRTMLRELRRGSAEGFLGG